MNTQTTTARPRTLAILLAGSCLAAATFLVAPALAQTEPPAKPTGKTTASDKAAEKAAKAAETAAAKAKAKWFDKLDKEDKAASDECVGFAAPAFADDAERIGASFKAMADLRGKVVVLQTFTSKNAAGLMSVKQAQAALTAAGIGDEGVLIAIHTPDALDKAKAVIEKQKFEMPILLDASGSYCDALGAFRKPIAYIVDRQGNVRYAGLSEFGITAAAKELAAAEFDPAIEAKKRDESVMPTNSKVAFPTFTEPVGSSADLRGKTAPNFFVQKWWNGEPNMKGKLAILDFWATWCGPCRAAIPHMNEIAKAYPNDVACMGITDESQRDFDEGCLKHRINKSDFAYAVGLDSTASMKNAFAIRGIPSVAIISSDGIVRWQGHPMGLTPAVVDSLIASNRALVAGASGGSSSAGKRWSRVKR